MLDGYLKVLRNTIFGFKHHRDKAELPITLLQLMEFLVTAKYNVVSCNRSRLKGQAGLFRLLIKEIFYILTKS